LITHPIIKRLSVKKGKNTEGVSQLTSIKSPY
jgi:hypothetical protein